MVRIVFYGTPAFAVPTLETLLASDHKVVAVVTQPDRARGRGRQVTFSPVKQSALDAGLPILQPERAELRDSTFSQQLQSLNAELSVVAAYGRILPDQYSTHPDSERSTFMRPCYQSTVEQRQFIVQSWQGNARPASPLSDLSLKWTLGQY